MHGLIKSPGGIGQATLAEHVAEIHCLRKRVTSDIIEIGRRLTECQDIVGHGHWHDWLEAEFGWSDQSALNFMRVYDMSKSKNFLDLNIPLSSLYLLAAPSTPDEVRIEIFDRAKAGETISIAGVKDAIADAKAEEAEMVLLDPKTAVKPTVGKRAPHPRRTQQQIQLDQFTHAIRTLSTTTCTVAEMMGEEHPIPPLDVQHTNDAVAQLEEVRTALDDLIRRIRSKGAA